MSTTIFCVGGGTAESTSMFTCCVCGKARAMEWSQAQDGTVAYFHMKCYIALCRQRREAMLRNKTYKRVVNKEVQHEGE